MIRAVLRNVEKGVKVAAIGACVLVAWTGLVRLVAGEGAFSRHGVTYPRMVFAYLVGGAAAGGLAGLLAPLARWRLGGVLVGAIAGLPFGGLMAYAKFGPHPWQHPGANTSIIAAAMLGAFVG